MSDKIYIECICGFVGVIVDDEVSNSENRSIEDEIELEDEKETCPKCMREIVPIDDEDKMNEIDNMLKTRKKGVENYTGEQDE